MINCIPALLYVFTTYRIYKYMGNFFCLSVYIWLLHTISMLCFWVKADFLYPFPNEYTYEALSIMFLTLFAITIPLMRFEKRSKLITSVIDINERKLTLLTKGLIVLSIYSIGFFAVNLPKVFAANIVDLRSERVVFYTSNIFSKVACLGAFSSVFCIYLYFYFMMKDYTTPQYSTNG